MTTYNKATLKTFFAQNDVPQGTDYANFIDSYVNIVDTTLQSMAGPLQTTEITASRVSAGNGNYTGTLTVAGQFSAKSNFKVKSITASALTVTNNISANNEFLNGTLSIVGQTSAANLNIGGDFVRPVVQFNAAGTAQASATLLTAGNCLLTGASDGQATGYILQSNKTGLVQFVYNQNAVSANLWPCTGGQINVLASNAAFGMTASTMYTVYHTKASGYAVK